MHGAVLTQRSILSTLDAALRTCGSTCRCQSAIARRCLGRSWRRAEKVRVVVHAARSNANRYNIIANAWTLPMALLLLMQRAGQLSPHCSHTYKVSALQLALNATQNLNHHDKPLLPPLLNFTSRTFGHQLRTLKQDDEQPRPPHAPAPSSLPGRPDAAVGGILAGVHATRHRPQAGPPNQRHRPAGPFGYLDHSGTEQRGGLQLPGERWGDWGFIASTAGL